MIEEREDLWGSVRPPHAPDHTAEESLIPLPTPSHMFQGPLRVGLKAVVAVKQPLEGQRLPSREELYKWLVRTLALDSHASPNRPGTRTPAYPSP